MNLRFWIFLDFFFGFFLIFLDFFAEKLMKLEGTRVNNDKYNETQTYFSKVIAIA